MISSVRVPAAVWDHLLRHAAEAAPEECCGLLLGHPGGSIVEAAPASNVAVDRVRHFQVDPAAHFAAIRHARATGLEVVGAYHSHPAGSAVPSETDRVQAFEDETFVHLLIDPRKGEIAAYFLITGNFVAVPLVRVP